MAGLARRLEAAVGRALAGADGLMNRLYGWRYNPLYQSGTLVVVLLLVTLVTGLYLLLFYRIGSPYESVLRITEQAWLGRWVRSLHRYASDALLVATAVHALRLFAQGRSWGPRTLAWLSGLALTAVILVVGWTGYIMVWDVQAQVLAAELARLLDVLPLFSEPLARAFTGERPVPSAFFFLNLFVHILLPVGMALLLWIHVSRLARVVLLPPRAITWTVLAVLFALSVVWPVGMAAEAELLRLPERAPFDAFYAFWLPLTRAAPAGVVWAVGGALLAVALLVPWWARPDPARRGRPSVVNERLCTGCEQCAEDCPYEAILMVPRAEGERGGLMARVDASLCVSCGVCAGSCAPMGVGPPLRTGRDQLAEAASFLERQAPLPTEVVVIGCERALRWASLWGALDGWPVHPVVCAGNAHTSVIESLLRGGAGGVAVVGCPPRDCWNREGAVWVEQRMYHDREAELQARVDRRRVRLLYGWPGGASELARELGSFRSEVVALARAGGEPEADLLRLCRRPRLPEGV